VFAAPKVKPDAIPDHRPDYSAGSGHPPEDRAEKTNVRVLPVRGRHSAKPARLPASSPRRRWLSRAVLLVILAAQAVLTLRMHNTAFEDEALYLYVGHLEIAHWLHGASLQGNYPSYFSGSPVLYPVLGAVADSIGGLVAARAVSLIEMLATTALLYALARRLFNERVALCGAVIFSVTEPTLYLGHLATYDATALCLLALAAWLVVRTAEFPWPAYLLAAPLTALAVASKYASLLFVPSVVLLAGLAAWPRHGRKALIRPIAVAVTVAGLLAGALYLGGANYLQGVRFTTLERFQGTAPRATLLWDSLQWAGLPFALAVIGSVAYAVRPYNEPGEQIAPGGSRLRRIMLGAVLAGSAMLAPAEQIRIYTLVSLYKHIGFGLFFAAPIAGVGLARVVGDHFRRAQVGIAIWGATLALGMTQANNLFNAWPNSSKFVADMSVHLRPGARYLVEVDEVPIYYLRHHSDAQPDQFTSTYFIGYVDQQGKYVTGNAAYVAAIKAGYFQMVGYNYQTTPSVDGVLARTLATSSFYRLAAAIPNGNDSVTQYLWVRTARPASHRVSRRRAGP
jgi:hypothetical protein